MDWVLVANSNTYRIFSYNKDPAELTLIKEEYHPEIRHKSGDFLTTDRPGHYQTSHVARGAYEPHTSPKQAKINAFARQIGDFLDHEEKLGNFKKLVIFAEPHMNGILLKHFTKQLASKIKGNIHKDLIKMSKSEIVDCLKLNSRKK